MCTHHSLFHQLVQDRKKHKMSSDENSKESAEETVEDEEITEVTEDATEEVTVEEDEATEDEEETKNSESLAAPDPEKCFQSDQEYFRALSDKELKWLWKNFKTYGNLDEGTWKCTACFKQINHKVINI